LKYNCFVAGLKYNQVDIRRKVTGSQDDGFAARKLEGLPFFRMEKEHLLADGKC
jgi:hypothetical protein